MLALAVAASLAACNRGPLTVSTVQLGRSLNSDNSIGDHATRFAPTDTIYVSVLTDGPGRGTISVRWLFDGRLISEPSRDVSYRDQAATEFRIQNSGGFPPGSYSVEVMLDGVAVDTRNFRVAQ